jgi:hypothetical protein
MIRNSRVSTLAGEGSKGYLDAESARAWFEFPRSVAVGPDGTVYVTESGKFRIRTILKGKVSTMRTTDQSSVRAVAVGQESSVVYSTDTPGYIFVVRNGQSSGLPSSSSTQGVAVSQDGTIYFTQPGKVQLSRAGQVAAVTTSKSPDSIAVGSDGSVYFVELSTHSIKVIRGREVSTFAGSREGFLDGPATDARFSTPSGIAVGPDGAVYVADMGNHRIRVIRNGVVSTLAGCSEGGYEDGPAADLNIEHRFDILAIGIGKACKHRSRYSDHHTWETNPAAPIFHQTSLPQLAESFPEIPTHRFALHRLIPGLPLL